MFHLDDASALAAGHRPCGQCRREEYLAYRAGVTRGSRQERPLSSIALDALLAAERLRRGRGLDRGGDRITWDAPARDLPDGTVHVDDGTARVLVGDRSLAFGFGGWHSPTDRPSGGSRC